MYDTPNFELLTGRKQIRNAMVMDHRGGIVWAILKHSRAVHDRFNAIEMRQPVRGRCSFGNIYSFNFRTRRASTSAHRNDRMTARRQMSDDRRSYQSCPSYDGNIHDDST